MSLVLEYPIKLFLLLVAVLVIIGIMWHFRDQITEICLIPPCEDEIECGEKTIPSHEASFTQDIIDKYCRLCWNKNRGGECSKDHLCYAVSTDSSSIPPDPSFEYCKNSCGNNVKTIFVEYKSLEKIVEITC